MKKLLSLLLALAVLLGLAGCPVANLPLTETTQATTTATEATAPEQTEATDATQAPTEKPEPTPTQAPEPKPTQPPETVPQQTRPAETQPETQPSIAPQETQPPLEPPETEQTSAPTAPATEPTTAPTEPAPQKSYTHKDEVAQYIHAHGCLPDNFITKSEARALGWKSGSLERYAPGKCIGGDRFYNREGILPSGHTYYECDIDTLGKSSRGAKRIVFSTDGLIYYTDDHYRTFTLLYGEP